MTADAKTQVTWFETTSDWIKRNPLGALLLLTIVATLAYFFGFVRLFNNSSDSTMVWAARSWNSETNYEHAWLIPFIVAFLVWWDWDKLKGAPTGSSRWGWLFIGLGLFLFFAGARTLQARIALPSLPFLLFGMVLYVWGKSVARVLLFPIAFLLFMVPLNFLTQATAKLQLIETGVASAVCNLIGIHVQNVGAVVQAADNTFKFEVDEGCSGIHSLMAIAMIAAIYGHFTQDRLWKKATLFSGSLLFAIIGNAGRLVSIFVTARFFGQEFAGGRFHIFLGFLSFPFAIAAMMLFGKLLDFQPGRLKQLAAEKEKVTYDY